MRARKTSGALLKTCHISVLTNRTSAKTSSSGTARLSSSSDAASWPTQPPRRPAHDRQHAEPDDEVDDAEQQRGCRARSRAR